MTKIFITIGLFICLNSVSQSYKSEVWVADQGNGTYKNPV